MCIYKNTQLWFFFQKITFLDIWDLQNILNKNFIEYFSENLRLQNIYLTILKLSREHN